MLRVLKRSIFRGKTNFRRKVNNKTVFEDDLMEIGPSYMKQVPGTKFKQNVVPFLSKVTASQYDESLLRGGVISVEC